MSLPASRNRTVGPSHSRWYRKLIAQKYDGTDKRGPGRPRTAAEIDDWKRTAALRVSRGAAWYTLTATFHERANSALIVHGTGAGSNRYAAEQVRN